MCEVVKKELPRLQQMAAELRVSAEPWECVVAERGLAVPFSQTHVVLE